MAEQKSCPCEECILRKRIARGFDMFFWGEDCPWECADYEEWRSDNG